MNKEKFALEFATKAHEKQTRKYNKEPYINHCISVRDTVADWCDFGGGRQSFALQAALLHDTVEDTSTSIQDILENFGEEVATLVWWLTDFDTKAQVGNRATRKLATVWRLQRAPIEARAIKLADLIDNTKDIVKNDKEFAVTYLKEKKHLLDNILVNLSNYDNFIVDLYWEAKQQLEICEKELNNEEERNSK